MATKLLGVAVILITISNISLSAPVDDTQIKCNPRDYGQGSIVCVCNAERCDTIPRIQKSNNTSTYIKYTSNQNGLRFEKETGLSKKFTSSEPINNVVHVNIREQYQEIIGWGGAFSDATGINIATMSEGIQEQILKSYFGEDSIEYNLCRVPIAATDFSTHPYTYLEEEDKTLSNFSLAEEDFKYKIPFILKAMKMSENSLKLFGSPWTAPLWMKTSPSYAGSGTIKEEFYTQWAQYFEKFLDHYQQNGIKFWGVTTGNEPSLTRFPLQATPTVGWKPEAMQTFIKDHLGPILKSSNHPDIKIIALDDQRGFLPDLKVILNDSKTYSYVDGVGVHWYQDWYKSALLLNESHETFPDKFLLATEACEGSFILDTVFKTNVILGSWDRAESYAYDIIEDINHWITGWVSWNMVLNLNGGPTYTSNFVDAPIIVNYTSEEFYKQPMYYAHGHFSKFVPRGSRRIYVSGMDNTNSSVYISGFKRPDDGIVLVVLNRLNETIPFNIVDETKQISENLSPHSLTTFVYWN